MRNGGRRFRQPPLAGSGGGFVGLRRFLRVPSPRPKPWLGKPAAVPLPEGAGPASDEMSGKWVRQPPFRTFALRASPRASSRRFVPPPPLVSTLAGVHSPSRRRCPRADRPFPIDRSRSSSAGPLAALAGVELATGLMSWSLSVVSVRPLPATQTKCHRCPSRAKRNPPVDKEDNVDKFCSPITG